MSSSTMISRRRRRRLGGRRYHDHTHMHTQALARTSGGGCRAAGWVAIVYAGNGDVGV